MTNEKTDTTDEPSKAELHERVEQLESTVAKMMPSRRDALKLGAAGIAGAAGLSATSQTAEASTGSAGQIGDVNNRPDVFADTVDANQLTGVNIESLNPGLEILDKGQVGKNADGSGTAASAPVTISLPADVALVKANAILKAGAGDVFMTVNGLSSGYETTTLGSGQADSVSTSSEFRITQNASGRRTFASIEIRCPVFSDNGNRVYFKSQAIRASPNFNVGSIKNSAGNGISQFKLREQDVGRLQFVAYGIKDV